MSHRYEYLTDEELDDLDGFEKIRHKHNTPPQSDMDVRKYDGKTRRKPYERRIDKFTE